MKVLCAKSSNKSYYLHYECCLPSSNCNRFPTQKTSHWKPKNPRTCYDSVIKLHIFMVPTELRSDDWNGLCRTCKRHWGLKDAKTKYKSIKLQKAVINWQIDVFWNWWAAHAFGFRKIMLLLYLICCLEINLFFRSFYCFFVNFRNFLIYFRMNFSTGFVLLRV